MKNVYEVLRQKELELTRLEKEVEALRVAAPLLSEEKEQMAEAPKPTLTSRPTATSSGPPGSWPLSRPMLRRAQWAGKMQPSAGHKATTRPGASSVCTKFRLYENQCA